jgi:hypothetical protein
MNAPPDPIERRRVVSTHRPQGTVLVAALVALVIVMAMLGVMLQSSLRNRRQLHAERDRRQCELLLQAGVERAAYRLANDAEYQGETWRLAADEITNQGEGEVVITASPMSDEESWRVHVVAEFPLGSERSIRRSRTCQIIPETPVSQE